ncbi:MAG: elongation factor P [Candidatus Pacebacteria bacterium]|nr:elongation factor P [Candidatus Paceibacterota bacterium]
MAKVKAGNIKQGMYLLYKGHPHRVTKKKFVSPGKGSAFTRTKLQDLRTGAIFEFTFKSHDSVEEVFVESKEMQFLYKSSDQVIFMDPRTYEQVEIPVSLIQDQVDFLVPELSVYLSFYEGKALGMSLPPKVTMEVTKAQKAIAGDRSNAGTKPVTMETGLVVQAPLFIEKGEKLIIDTESGAYVSRAS